MTDVEVCKEWNTEKFTFVNIAFLGKRGLNDFPSLNLLPPLSLASASLACSTVIYTILGGGGEGRHDTHKNKVLYLSDEDRKYFNFHVNQLFKKNKASESFEGVSVTCDILLQSM